MISKLAMIESSIQRMNESYSRGGIEVSDLYFLVYEILAAWIPFLVMILLSGRIKRKKGIEITRQSYLLLFVFAAYISSIFYITGAGTLCQGLEYGIVIDLGGVNLIPFYNINTMGFFLNILLFVPFGILVPLIWQKKNGFLPVLFSGFAFSLLIEVSQLLGYRVSDVDDLMTNTVGAIFGFFLYRIWRKCTKWKHHDAGEPVAGLVAVIFVLFFGRFFLFHELGFAR